MKIRVLGPLEITENGRRVQLGRPKQQRVLGVLATAAGRLVSLDELIAELWGERPVPSAAANVRLYVSELRRILGGTGISSFALERTGSGYILHLGDENLDLLEYVRDAYWGRRAYHNGDFTEAARHLQRGWARWRGWVCDGLPRGDVMRARAPAVEADYAALTDELACVRLGLGELTAAVALLERQLEGDPVRERSYELLMHACYRLEGTAATLRVYDRARKHLVERLGVEPSSSLQRLQWQVLNGEPILPPLPRVTDGCRR